MAGDRARDVIWLEVIVGFVVPIGWGIWQLVDLRRERRKDEAARPGGVRTER